MLRVPRNLFNAQISSERYRPGLSSIVVVVKGKGGKLTPSLPQPVKTSGLKNAHVHTGKQCI